MMPQKGCNVVWAMSSENLITNYGFLQLFSDLLHVSVNIICCKKTSFFQLGGNSLSAIQLILEDVSACDEMAPPFNVVFLE